MKANFPSSDPIGRAARRLRGWLPVVTIACLLSACGGGGGGSNSPVPGGSTSTIAGAPPTNTVTGSITFKGTPLAGVTVVAYDTNTNSVFQNTTTDAAGHYSFAGLQTGCNCVLNYQLFAAKPGYSFHPWLASDPQSAQAGYQFDPSPQNWYVTGGTALTRADYNGVFTNPNGGAGIVFDVVNIMSVVGNSVVGANFDAYDGSNPPVRLAATGQRLSYAGGDDAAAGKGVAWPATRFIDNQDGTVTDQLSGLVWLKNAGCFAPTAWANALAEVGRLASGACGLADGSKAGQWRMPNAVELESLVDVAAMAPALTPGHPYTDVASGIYWTSTAYFGGQQGTTSAWAVNLADGSYVNDSVRNLMASSQNGVWAVRGTGGGAMQLQASGAYVPFAPGDDGSARKGAPLPAPRMLDNGNGTVTDTLTGLVWLKQANCIQQPWAAALATVGKLAHGQCGLSDGSAAGDWRMPNRLEMLSLADRSQNNQTLYFDESFVSGQPPIPSQPAVFTGMVAYEYYWTSTTDAASIDQAWTVFSCDFGVYGFPKSSASYTLAVR